MKNLIVTSIVALAALSGEVAGNTITNLYHPTTTTTVNLIPYHTQSHRFYFGPEAFWAHADAHYSKYRVDADAVFGGLRIGYDFVNPRNVYFGLEFLPSFGKGKTEIKSNSTHVRHGGREAFLANEELRLGYNFSGSVDNRWIFTPFAGVGGYQYRPRGRYHFDEKLYYAAFGLRTDYSVTHDFDIGLHLKGLYTFNVKVTEHSLDVSRSEHNKWGYQVALPLTWKVGSTNDWDIQLQPYVVKFQKTIDNLFVGLRLAFGYSF